MTPKNSGWVRDGGTDSEALSARRENGRAKRRWAGHWPGVHYVVGLRFFCCAEFGPETVVGTPTWERVWLASHSSRPGSCIRCVTCTPDWDSPRPMLRRGTVGHDECRSAVAVRITLRGRMSCDHPPSPVSASHGWATWQAGGGAPPRPGRRPYQSGSLPRLRTRATRGSVGRSLHGAGPVRA